MRTMRDKSFTLLWAEISMSLINKKSGFNAARHIQKPEQLKNAGLLFQESFVSFTTQQLHWNNRSLSGCYGGSHDKTLQAVSRSLCSESMARAGEPRGTGNHARTVHMPWNWKYLVHNPISDCKINWMPKKYSCKMSLYMFDDNLLVCKSL